MEICQRQEDAGISIIRNMNYNGLANLLVLLRIGSCQIICKNNFNFGSGNSFKKSEKIKK
jgi:hypothetical protein